MTRKEAFSGACGRDNWSSCLRIRSWKLKNAQIRYLYSLVSWFEEVDGYFFTYYEMPSECIV